MFRLEGVLLLDNNQLGEQVDGRGTDGPVEGVEDMHLHLSEHAGVVEATAHVAKLVYLRHPVLLVPVLGGNQESGTAHQLVVLLVDDTPGAVSVEEVDGKEQSLGEQREGGVGFDEKVDEVRPHEPLNLALHVDEIGIG